MASAVQRLTTYKGAHKLRRSARRDVLSFYCSGSCLSSTNSSCSYASASASHPAIASLKLHCLPMPAHTSSDCINASLPPLPPPPLHSKHSPSGLRPVTLYHTLHDHLSGLKRNPDVIQKSNETHTRPLVIHYSSSFIQNRHYI